MVFELSLDDGSHAGRLVDTHVRRLVELERDPIPLAERFRLERILAGLLNVSPQNVWHFNRVFSARRRGRALSTHDPSAPANGAYFTFAVRVVDEAQARAHTNTLMALTCTDWDGVNTPLVPNHLRRLGGAFFCGPEATNAFMAQSVGFYPDGTCAFVARGSWCT